MQSVPETEPLQPSFTLDWEKIVFALVLLLAVLTRFYKLEPRVMSHDENSHVYYSWLLYEGRGYQHDPITHGPFQFHVVALSYFVFGATDTTARIPAVLFSIATIAFMWYFRKYLGRVGALVAAVLFLISPYMLYYGRYVRNESFVAFFGVITIWATLAYMETGKPAYILWLTAATVLHFTVKETSYIYTAQLLLFLGLYFVYRVTTRPWAIKSYRSYFIISLMAMVAAVGVAMLPVYRVFQERKAIHAAAKETVVEQVQGISPSLTWAVIIMGIIALVALVAAVYFILKGFRLEKIKQERSFDLVIVIGTLMMPLLAAFPLRLIGWDVPTNASSVIAMNTVSILRMGAVVLLMAAIAIVVGLWWNRRLWLINAALFYAIFTFFYTTYFTNTDGFFTGLLGSLGYWMAQQAVQRADQPWFYYIFLQIPVYEYLPALVTFLGFGMLLRRKKKQPVLVAEIATNGTELVSETEPTEPEQRAPTVTFLAFWVLSAIVAYSYAGEKMPWLTVHIALPLILFAGWTMDRWIGRMDLKGFSGEGKFLQSPLFRATLLLIIFILNLVVGLGLFLTSTPPLSGNSLEASRSTGIFVVAMGVASVCLWLLSRTQKRSPGLPVGGLAVLLVISLLAILTARTAFTASYINYDRPLEYLVYAHCGTGVKEAMARIEDLSLRTTDGLYLKVAYDNETSYPYWWYLRDYPNAFGFGANPTFELKDYPAILVGDANYSKLDPVVKDEYISFDYIRIWWPNEDYKRLTWGSIKNELKVEWAGNDDQADQEKHITIFSYFAQAWKKHIGPFFKDARVREAIWDIWFYRDYTKYATLQGRTEFTLPTWSPSGSMRLYLRKDVVSQLWEYGLPEAERVEVPDPYEGKSVVLQADKVFGTPGNGEGQFQLPRSMAIAPDGSLYVADTYNYRIQHFSSEGEFLGQWGEKSPQCPYPGSPPTYVPTGTFCEPWGVAVGVDGSVYVADTWNQRIQKFTGEGQFLLTWGYGIAQDPADRLGFYGPRGLVVDSLGNVLVTDTGNSRVLVFDANGNPLSQFGSAGVALGQFAEPVGIALGPNGQVYIADTWNQRVQVFSSMGMGGYTATNTWEIAGWETTSVNNKPSITVDPQGNIFIADPDGYRVIEFNEQGNILRYWGNIGADAGSFNLPTGIAADAQGGVWVVDTNNNRLMHFTLPE